MEIRSIKAHAHGAMRRKEREITSREEIDAILGSAIVMNLALSDNDIPFQVPVFYAYDGTSIWFHSAYAGTKMEIIRRNPLVSFAVSVDQGFIENDEACDFEARHRTVIGFGKALFVEEDSEKIKALDLIVSRFSDRKFTYPNASVENTAVIRIEIASMKGKKHGV
jgi:hypothetical protein